MTDIEDIEGLYSVIEDLKQIGTRLLDDYAVLKGHLQCRQECQQQCYMTERR